jgi:hypothetical protein
MKRLNLLSVLFLLVLTVHVSNSQTITTGFYSGMNFSDIHGQNIGGKWVTKPGASEGFSLGYMFNRNIGFQTGLGIAVVSYEHRPLYQNYMNPIYEFTSSSYYDIIAPVYSSVQKMDFTFLKVPLLFTVTVPSKVNFDMRAGIVFSRVISKNIDQYTYYLYEPGPIKNRDFGYLFGSGLSYPLNNNIDLTLNFNYITGRTKFTDYSSVRHGYNELTLGLNYLFKRNKADLSNVSQKDSSSSGISITYFAGINYSWNTSVVPYGRYSSIIGHTLGFSINFPLGRGAFLVSGVSFERKGYSLKDSSTVFYMYLKNKSPMYSVDARVFADYAIVPVLLSIPVDNAKKIYISTGPWLGLRLNGRTVGKAYNKTTTEYTYQVVKTVIYDDLEYYLNNTDAGWTICLGTSLPLKNDSRIDLSLRFNTSFTDMFSKSKLTTYQSSDLADQKLRMRSLSFQLGFAFPKLSN